MTSVEQREWIRVTKNEQEIFDQLLRAVSNFSPETKLRVAGGWVRDKLLRKESNDIDITIDNMLGSQFFMKLNDYLRSQGEEEVQGHVIETKPTENDKQPLEIVKMRIDNHSIDLVHLRKEVFAEKSRIPVKVEFASAEEDAYRRDLTINSLFYNIHTRLVEDFTGRGINDLKSGIIATPLDPRVTFLNDPLRVLRAIRFAARFGFTLDEEVIEAVSSDEVRKALAEKISRERIGNEMDLMITGNEPVSAVTYLCDLNLFGVVFALPEPAPSENCRAYMEAMWKIIKTFELGYFSVEETRIALYAALLLPLREMVYKDKKGKLVNVVNYIFKVNLKLKNSDADTVVNIHRVTGRFLSLILPLQLKNDEVDKREWEGTDVFDHLETISLNDPEFSATSKIRVLAGFLLRDIKDSWRVALLISLLMCTDDEDKKREIYLTVEGNIRQLCLDTIWEFDGNDIIKALQLANKGQGPIIRQWQQKLLTWQLAYPEGWMPLRQRQAKRTKAM